MIERLARLPVDVDYASEYRYRDPIAGPDALGLLITQSGETADTLAAQREMKALGSKTVAICNVVGAMVAREAHGADLYARGAGDRRGVDQGVYVATDGAVFAGAEAGPGARQTGRRRRRRAD